MSEEKQRHPKVFLSYAHEDQSIAQRISTALKDTGIEVFSDVWELSAGDSIHSRIFKSVSASDFLVVLLSKNSVRSEWVQTELSAGFLGELSSRAVTVIPILLDRVEVPPGLRDKIYLDLTENEEAGLATLNRQLSVAPDIDFSRMSHESFESLVADLLTEVGFEVKRSSQGAKDLGFDFAAAYQSEDPFGAEETSLWMIQCKQYRQERLSVAALQKLFRALSTSYPGYQALVVTNGLLTSVAREYLTGSSEATGRRLRVIDGNELTGLLLRRPDLAGRYFPMGARP